MRSLLHKRLRPFRAVHTKVAVASSQAYPVERSLLHHKALHLQSQPHAVLAPPTSVYIHLPFCARKCWYCDFPVEAVGRNFNGPVATTRYEEYVNVVRSEVAVTCNLSDGSPLQTVFFGGGTPSLVPPDLIAALLGDLRSKYGLAHDAEISMEADPGTFDLARLQQYMAAGINRFSMGVQAFQQDLLSACGRAHSLQDVYAAVDAMHASGVRSWSLDLISGLPALDMHKWQHSLAEAIKAAPTHVSVYDLQVEEGTPFSRWYDQGKLALPGDESAAAMYTAASEALRAAGYEHYEISNYARPGHQCTHNKAYWLGAQYYAFGMGAASYLQGRRFTRPSKMKEYVAWVRALPSVDGGLLPASDQPPEAKEDLLLDSVMLRLRMAEGLDLGYVSRQHGADTAAIILESLQPHVLRGSVLLQPSAGTGSRAGMAVPHQAQQAPGDAPVVARLTDPQGFLLSNDIISDVFASFSF